MKRVAVALAAVSLAGSVQATDLACGAYLCSTVGFAVPGCFAVKVAMYKRVWRLPPKSPIPSWGECTSESNDIESVPEGMDPQEWADALTMAESMNDMETPDHYGFLEKHATLIYAKTWNPAKGGEWVAIPDWSIPPRIIDLIAPDDLTDADLAPDMEGAPPWFAVAKLKQLATLKNGEQYGDTLYFNSYNDNPWRYDRNDYQRDIETGEIALAGAIVESDQVDPVTVAEPEQSTANVDAPDVQEGIDKQQLIDTLVASKYQETPEGMTAQEWQDYLQAAIDDLEQPQ